MPTTVRREGAITITEHQREIAEYRGEPIISEARTAADNDGVHICAETKTDLIFCLTEDCDFTHLEGMVTDDWPDYDDVTRRTIYLLARAVIGLRARIEQLEAGR